LTFLRKRWKLILGCMLTILFFMTAVFWPHRIKQAVPVQASISSQAASASSGPANLQERLRSLEPAQAQNISDPPFFEPLLPISMAEPSVVMQDANRIADAVVYANPAFARGAYYSYWHSSLGNWSYLPRRVHYALHRVAAIYPTASLYNSFIYELGLVEESTKFGVNFDNPYQAPAIAVFNTDVQNVYAAGNQIVISGKPVRRGLTIVQVDLRALKDNDHNQPIAVQVVTPQGDEVDVTTIENLIGKN
jgi:hypothetical protein